MLYILVRFYHNIEKTWIFTKIVGNKLSYKKSFFNEIIKVERPITPNTAIKLDDILTTNEIIK